MRRYKGKIKHIIINVIVFTVGFILALALGYAATILFNSDEVAYNNTNTGMNSTTVQGALDELYEKANKHAYTFYMQPSSDGRVYSYTMPDLPTVIQQQIAAGISMPPLAGFRDDSKLFFFDGVDTNILIIDMDDWRTSGPQNQLDGFLDFTCESVYRCSSATLGLECYYDPRSGMPLACSSYINPVNGVVYVFGCMNGSCSSEVFTIS